jgi:hypothetical protein
MPQAHYISDPGHWRDRAEQCVRSRQDYDRLAARAEQRSDGSTR